MCKAFLKREYPFFLLFLQRQWEAYSWKTENQMFYKNLNASFTFPLLPAIKWLGRWEAQPSGKGTPPGTPWATTGASRLNASQHSAAPLGYKSGHRRAKRAGKQHAASPEPTLSQMCMLQRWALQIPAHFHPTLCICGGCHLRSGARLSDFPLSAPAEAN